MLFLFKVSLVCLQCLPQRFTVETCCIRLWYFDNLICDKTLHILVDLGTSELILFICCVWYTGIQCVYSAQTSLYPHLIGLAGALMAERKLVVCWIQFVKAKCKPFHTLLITLQDFNYSASDNFLSEQLQHRWSQSLIADKYGNNRPVPHSERFGPSIVWLRRGIQMLWLAWMNHRVW